MHQKITPCMHSKVRMHGQGQKNHKHVPMYAHARQQQVLGNWVRLLRLQRSHYTSLVLSLTVLQPDAAAASGNHVHHALMLADHCCCLQNRLKLQCCQPLKAVLTKLGMTRSSPETWRMQHLCIPLRACGAMPPKDHQGTKQCDGHVKPMVAMLAEAPNICSHTSNVGHTLLQSHCMLQP